MKHQIVGKDKEYRRVTNEVKECRLEIQNNEKIFDTFFLTPEVPAINVRTPPSSSRSNRSARSNRTYSRASVKDLKETRAEEPPVQVTKTKRRKSYCYAENSLRGLPNLGLLPSPQSYVDKIEMMWDTPNFLSVKE